VGLGAGAGFGLAAGYALMATEVRNPRLRLVAATLAGFAMLFVSLLLALTLKLGTLPSPFGFEVIARIAVLLGPSSVFALAVADYLEQPSGFLRATVFRSVLAAIGGLPFWIIASDEPKTHLLPALGAGALFGLAMAFARRLSLAPRRSLHVGFAVALLAGTAGLTAWERIDRRDANPYGRMPGGRALFRLGQYIDDHNRQFEAELSDVSGAAALKALAERFNGVDSTPPLPGETLEGVAREYARLRASLDPDWGTDMGLLTGVEGLTRHRDQDLRERAALDVSLYAALARSPDGEILQPRLAFMLWSHALRDLREVDPTLALEGVHAIYALLARSDLPLELRRRSARARLADLPRVIEETPPRGSVLDEDLSSCDAVTAYLESLQPHFDAAPELAEALGAVRRHRAAIDARPRLKGGRRLGLGPLLFRAMLNAEGETRPFGDLALFARQEIIDSFTDALNKFLHLSEAPDRVALQGYQEEDPNGRLATEMAAARKQLGTAFPVAPPGEVTIAVAAPFQEDGSAAAIYHPLGALEGPPDALVLRVKREPSPDRLALRTLAWHEAWPGHHLQQLLARAHAPFARRVLPSSFYIEGWASYAEGFIETAAKSEEQLLQGALRTLGRADEAVQVLEDLVVHVLQPTEDEAADLLKRAHGLSLDAGRARARSVHHRAGRSSAYALGRDAFTKARAARQAALGDKYTDLDFHTTVLQLGPVPPGRLIELLGRPK
jgi:hypothetical protein